MKLENFDFTKKIFNHPKKILDYQKNKRPFPTSIEIDLTNNCNHRCSFCFYADKIGRGKMPTLNTKIIKKAIKDLKVLGTKGISFTGGGESMLHSDFLEIVSFTKKNNIDVGLITNGSAITENKLDILTKNLTWIRVSMAGGDEKSYLEVQGVNHFKKVLKNISDLSKYKKNNNSKLNIGIRILVTKENINSLLEINKYLEYEVINYLQIAPDQFTKDKGKFWYSSKVQNIFKQLEDNLNKLNIKLLTSNYVWQQENIKVPQKCYAHFFHAVITAEGDLIFCKNARGNKKYILGNIYEKSLKEIWNSKKNKEIEKWVKPSNCGLYCKSIGINLSMERYLNPSPDDSINFVG